MRAKLMAETVTDVVAGTELLKQAKVDPSRVDVAESFIRRRMLEAQSVAHRIEDNAAGGYERDVRILGSLLPNS
jgi:hypothetical protein